MLDIDVKNRQNLARRSQILIPIATVRQAASARDTFAIAGVVVKNGHFPLPNTIPAIAKSRESRATKPATLLRGKQSDYSTMDIEIEPAAVTLRRSN